MDAKADNRFGIPKPAGHMVSLLTAILNARTVDIKTLDEQRTVIRKRQEDVAIQRTEQLAVGVASMAVVAQQSRL